MKNLFLFLCLTLSTQFVFAQKFSFGLKGGANVTDWYYSKPSKNPSISDNFHEPVISYEFGATARQKLSKRVYLNEELLYTQRNMSINKKYFNGTTMYFACDYVAVPIFISYNVFKPLSLELGGEYSRIVKSSKFNYKETFQNEDFISGIVGLRYQFLKKLNVHCRYTHAFTKINEITWTDFNALEIGKSKLLAHTLSLAIGYNF